MPQIDSSIFKDYDIRGIYPKQLNRNFALELGQEIVSFFNIKEVAVGQDARMSSPELFSGLVEGITSKGCDIVDLGMISTDMAWFASGKFGFPLTVMITASHNPSEWNGFKMATAGAVAVSGETGVYHLRDLLITGGYKEAQPKSVGEVSKQDILEDWVSHVLSFVQVSSLTGLKVVVDAGNGAAGKAVSKVFEQTKLELIPLFFEPDGRFPNHPADPMKEENLKVLAQTVVEIGANLGVAFDGDGDRVLFVDEKGKIISGTVTTALIAKNLLEKDRGGLILYNAIVGRIVPELIKSLGGRGMRVRVGYSIIKRIMREQNAIFCGEHSYHFFYRDNFFADSGLITLVLILEMIAKHRKKVSEIVSEFDVYPQSGEINFKVEDKEGALAIVRKYFASADSIDDLDGISVWYKNWWFNLRPSNTENLLRLNIEADTKSLLEEKKAEVVEKIEKLGGEKA